MFFSAHSLNVSVVFLLFLRGGGAGADTGTGGLNFPASCSIHPQLLSLLYFPPITLECWKKISHFTQFLSLWEITLPIPSLPTS